MAQQWPPSTPNPYQRRPVDINAYAPPRRSGSWWWLALLAAVLVGVVLAALFLRPPAPAPAPRPAPATTSAPGATAGPGMPFVMPGSTKDSGRWEVVRHEWGAQGLRVRVRVTADQGTVTYAFVAFSNNGSTTVYEPQESASDPSILSGRLSAGQSAEGDLMIPVPRGPATLIITTERGRQMSALPISG